MRTIFKGSNAYALILPKDGKHTFGLTKLMEVAVLGGLSPQIAINSCNLADRNQQPTVPPVRARP